MTALIPSPLPDELASGHIGRTFILSGIPEQKRNLRGLPLLAGYGSGGRLHLERLAQLSRISFGQYIYRHTLAPFFLVVQARQQIDWGSEPTNWWPLMISARKGVTRIVRFCPRCAEKDVEVLGFSYWRRTHQLPGVSWCVKHLSALCSTEANNSMCQLPDALIAEGKVDSRAKEFIDNPVLRRYGEICAGLLTRCSSISTTQITQVIQKQARLLNLRSRPGVMGSSHLDKIAIEQTNEAWLKEHFPDVFTRGSASSICRTYSSTDLALTTQSYALALALLFDQTNDALQTLNREDLSSPVSLFGSHLEAKEAISDFMAGLSLTQVVDKYGLRVGAVEELLRTVIRHAQQTQSMPGTALATASLQ